MAHDISDFRARFPEFTTVVDPIITANLGAAALEVDPTIWGAKTSEGILLLTAHKLTISPWGQAVRTTKQGTVVMAQTQYWQEYSRLMRMVASGFRVI